MKQIGITGGIGSGKSTVCKVFEALNIPVFYADDAGKFLLNNLPELIEKVKTYFGDDIYSSNQLNRQKLAQIVFNDSQKLQMLNSFVHPAVANFYEEWLSAQNAPYILKEAAILFESGSYKSLEKIIYVKAPEELRISRVIKRDNVTRTEVLKRINQQWLDTKKEPLSDFFIENSELKLLIPQVIQIHKTISQ